MGLDTDIHKIPKHLLNLPDPVFEFNKQIIDATKDLCVSYKLNTAFYEAQGIKGWESMEKTIHYIPEEHFTIADAKRGDIGNTSIQYATAFFEEFNFDALTIAPYMGEDSVRPFLEFENKWAIVLGLTSNKGAADFELLKLADMDGKGNASLRNEFLYERVIKQIAEWGTPENLMFVIGATQATEFENIRSFIPDHFLLYQVLDFRGVAWKK